MIFLFLTEYLRDGKPKIWTLIHLGITLDIQYLIKLYNTPPDGVWKI